MGVSDAKNARIAHRLVQWLRVFAALCAAAILSACQGNAALSALNAITPDSAYSLKSDVPYGSESRQTMDIYTPDAPTSQSRVVVFVYGGAWRKGIKEDYEFVAHALAGEGHWVIIPDYRLYPEVSFPAFVEDVVLAIKSLPEALTDELPDGITDAPTDTAATQQAVSDDSTLPVVLLGHSSGAHTAALIAADASWLADSSVQLNGLIAMSGPYDLPLDYPEVRSVFSRATDNNRAQPLALATDNHPPTLLIHGENDRRVLPLHTERYADALTALGIDIQVLWLDDGGHASPLTGLSRVLPDNGVFERVTAFLE